MHAMSYMQKRDKKSTKKNKAKSGTKTNSIFVRIDPDTALKLTRLGYMREIPSEVITKLIDHARICDLWQLQKDEEDES